jgi:hypothetical protein
LRAFSKGFIVAADPFSVSSICIVLEKFML